MTVIPYRNGIYTLPIKGNGNVKHKRKRETKRTPTQKQKRKFETSAFASLQRALARRWISHSSGGVKSPASRQLERSSWLMKGRSGAVGNPSACVGTWEISA